MEKRGAAKIPRNFLPEAASRPSEGPLPGSTITGLRTALDIPCRLTTNLSLAARFRGPGGSMSAQTYAYGEGLRMFYDGEVLGETIYSAMLAGADDSVERLKLSHLLQLETETKAWLRPHLMSAGVCVVEPPAVREQRLGRQDERAGGHHRGRVRDALPPLR